MHRTANALLPDMYPAPELGTAIYVRRQVRIEDGVLVEDSLPSFSYNR
jgi:Xaa-Pro aminopeptidase